MTIYHLTTKYGIALAAYTVERETARLYFVRDGKALGPGYARSVRRLRKEQFGIYTDRSAAIDGYCAAIERAIAGHQQKIANLERQLDGADALREQEG